MLIKISVQPRRGKDLEKKIDSWVGGELIGHPPQYSWACLVAHMAKSLPAMWETRVQSLGWENPLEKGTATHSSFLAWRIPWTFMVHGVEKSRT